MSAETAALQQEHKPAAKSAWKQSHKWGSLLLALFIVVTAAALVFLFHPKKMKVLTGKDTVVVADFAKFDR